MLNVLLEDNYDRLCTVMYDFRTGSFVKCDRSESRSIVFDRNSGVFSS